MLLGEQTRRPSGPETGTPFDSAFDGAVRTALEHSRHGRWLDAADAALIAVGERPRDAYAFQLLRSIHGRIRVGGKLWIAGGPGWKQKAYTRLFRSAVVYAMKSFFTAGVDVSLVVHDRADVEHDPFFDWHALWRINLDHGIRCDGTRIQFCDSNHNLPGVDARDSTMIQLTDLLLGATRLGMEATSVQAHKVAVADHWMPLLERLTDERRYRNPNSRFRHVGRCSVSFFPSRALSKAELACDIDRARSRFYVSRRPRLLDRHQLAFDI